MIEANEDISLVTERQMRDVEEGQAQAKAIAEGREVHPALLTQKSDGYAPSGQPASETEAQALQPEPVRPPADPEAAFRHVRLGIVAILVMILFFLWLRQRRG